jgi:hypothetical protein
MKYKWIANSNDGWEYRSSRDFDTKKEAYEDMRYAALEKMTWNTDYEEDLSDGDVIDYKVYFQQDKIVHESYSGTYTYQIVEIPEEKEYSLYADVTICVHDFIKAKSEDEARKIFMERITNNTHYYVNKFDSVINTEITDCIEE